MTRHDVNRTIIPLHYLKEFLAALDDPATIWQKAFEAHISEDSRSLLYVLYSLGSIASLMRLDRAFNAFIDQSHFPDIKARWTPSDRLTRSLKELDGSFTFSEKAYDVGKLITVIRFHNPSIRDFIERRMQPDIDLVHRLLSTSMYFEQTEYLAKLMPLELKRTPLLSIFLDALRRTVGSSSGSFTRIIYRADGVGRTSMSHPSDEEMYMRSYKMMRDLPFEASKDVYYEIMMRFQDRLNERKSAGKDAFMFFEVLEKDIFQVMRHRVAEALMDMNDWSDPESFAAIVEFNSTYPGLFTEEQIEALEDHFHDHCNDTLYSLEGMYSDDYRNEARRLEDLANTLDFAAPAIIRDILDQADELERRQQEEDEMNDLAETVMPQNNSANAVSEITNSEIHAMFNVLKGSGTAE